jgi:hypothetical protein
MTMQQFADNWMMADKYPFRMRANISPQLERNVCLCHRPEPLVKYKPSPLSQFYVCGLCNKIPVYYIYKCVSCDIEFLHDFQLNFCYMRPLCFDCNHERNESCKGHYYCVTYILSKQIRMPVIELKPQFTAEEMADVFDFE